MFYSQNTLHVHPWHIYLYRIFSNLNCQNSGPWFSSAALSTFQRSCCQSWQSFSRNSRFPTSGLHVRPQPGHQNRWFFLFSVIQFNRTLTKTIFLQSKCKIWTNKMLYANIRMIFFIFFVAYYGRSSNHI